MIRLVGEAVALEMLLEGRVLDAREALGKGLVTRVVPDDQVAREAQATAQRIAAGAPLVARWHKRFARRLRDPAPLTAAEVDEGYACFGTEDFRIGVREFLAKTLPEFKGRWKTAGPLQGLKVVELAQIMAGPTCGLMLADLGADVISSRGCPTATTAARVASTRSPARRRCS